MHRPRFPIIALASAAAFVMLLLYATNYMRLDGVRSPPDSAFRPDKSN